LAWATVASGLALLNPAAIHAQGVGPAQSYRVHIRHEFAVSGDVKAAACGGTCSEGHDCTTCVGVRIYAADQVISTTVLDKTPCCREEAGTRDRLNRLSLLSPWCGIHSCPTGADVGNRGPFLAELDLEIACVPAGDPVVVPQYVAVLGALSNNALSCGSRCSAADRFDAFDLGWRQDDRFGGFVTACASDDPAVVCEPVTECPRPVDESPALVARQAGALQSPTRWGAQRLRGARRWLDASWALHRKIL
jgi:hypothetical protein